MIDFVTLVQWATYSTNVLCMLYYDVYNDDCNEKYVTSKTNYSPIQQGIPKKTATTSKTFGALWTQWQWYLP